MVAKAGGPSPCPEQAGASLGGSQSYITDRELIKLSGGEVRVDTVDRSLPSRQPNSSSIALYPA